MFKYITTHFDGDLSLYTCETLCSHYEQKRQLNVEYMYKLMEREK